MLAMIALWRTKPLASFSREVLTQSSKWFMDLLEEQKKHTIS